MFMIDINKICQSFFKGKVKPKHLSEFVATTPQKNIISGYINHKPNEFLGSMVITHIKTQTNEFDTLQFVHAMPKIHYFSSQSCYLADDYNYKNYNCYEKLDGTCLILFPLFDNANQLIEIVPKSRTQPVANGFIIDMLKYIDMLYIEEYFAKRTGTVLIFELYGVLNRHELLYPQTYIDIRLIGQIVHNRFVADKELDITAKELHVKRPRIICNLICHHNYWNIDFFDGTSINQLPTQYDAINAIQVFLDNYNKEYEKRNHYIALEGVVIYGQNINDEHLYIKIKPSDLFERLTTEHGIRRVFILKEVRKYFDEYGYDAKSIYQKDRMHYLNYVKKNLLEEFSEDAVRRSESKIETVFLDTMAAREPPIGLQQICDELVQNNPDTDVPDLMRIFAFEYPEHKKKSRMVYQILKAKVK